MAARIQLLMLCQIDNSLVNIFAKTLLSYGDKGNDIDIIIDSPGGCIYSTRAIIRMLQTYKSKHPTAVIRAHVLSKAVSGAMLVVLAADEFYCSDFAQFGMIDPLVTNTTINICISKKDVEALSYRSTPDCQLEATVMKFKTEERIHFKFVKEMLHQNMKYSTRVTSILDLLYHSEDYCHYDRIDYATLERFGCKRDGIISTNLFHLLDKTAEHSFQTLLPVCHACKK